MGFNILNLKLKLETWVCRLPLTARLYGNKFLLNKIYQQYKVIKQKSNPFEYLVFQNSTN
jgi:hypothetical protein